MSTRTCIAVQKDKDGGCVCKRYAPVDVVPKSYEALCSEAGIPVHVGSTRKHGSSKSSKVRIKQSRSKRAKQLEGLDMAKHYDVLPPLEDIDYLEAPFFDKAILKSMLTQAGVGTVAIAGLSFGLSKIDMNKWLKTAIGAAVTLGGARLLWDKQRDAAQGLVGASSFVLADALLGLLTGEAASLQGSSKLSYQFKIGGAAQTALPTTEPGKPAGYLGEDDDEPEEYLESGSPYGEIGAGDEDSIFEAAVETEQRGGDFSAVSVQEERGFRGLVSVL